MELAFWRISWPQGQLLRSATTYVESAGLAPSAHGPNAELTLIAYVVCSRGPHLATAAVQGRAMLLVSSSVEGATVEGDRGQRDSRGAARTNVFLAATIESRGSNDAVRIRDISETGAMVEGRLLPGVGEELTLRRMHLQTSGRVVWRSSQRCGIKFEDAVVVKEWIGGSRSGGPQISGQSRVDDIKAAVRAGADGTARREVPEGEAEELLGKLDVRVAQELVYVARLLELVGNELADEPVVVQRHSAALQRFDVASQMLGHLATVLSSADRLSAVEAIGMEELRARLLRRRLFTPLH